MSKLYAGLMRFATVEQARDSATSEDDYERLDAEWEEASDVEDAAHEAFMGEVQR